METELEGLELLIAKSKKKIAQRPAVGEWDKDRKKWLMQWIRDVDMV